MIEKFVKEQVSKVRQMATNMLARAVIDFVNTEAGKTATAKITVLDGEEQEEVELLQQYGHASCPPKGTEAVVVYLGGRRSNGLIIATDSGNYRFQLEEGESALYTQEGDKIHLKKGRIIEIETKTLKLKATDSVEFDTPKFSCTGSVADSLGTLGHLRDWANQHTHIGNLGAPTSPPTQPETGGE